MKHLLLIFILAIPSWGQFVTITGTVKDPNGTPYAGGSGRVLLVSGNGSGNQSWMLGGTNPVNPVVIINNMDSTGAFSLRLTNTSIITPQSAQPKWKFQFCNSDASVCFTMTPMALTASQDITTTIQAQATVLPGTGGGGGSIIVGSQSQLLFTAVPNDPTGTTAGLLAKWTGSTLTTCTTADTTVNCLPVAAAITSGGTNLCSPGTTGNGCWGQLGFFPCTFDAAGAGGTPSTPHFVGESTTQAGRCKDLGASYPAGSCWTGTISGSVGAGGSGTILVRPACSLAPAGYSTIQSSGASSVQFSKLNFLSGFGIAPNGGNGSTDVSVGNPFPLSDGSAIAPSLVFGSAPTGPGWYRWNPQVWAFAGGGALKFLLTSNSNGSIEFIPGGFVGWCSDSTCSGSVDTNISRQSPSVVCSDKNSIGDCAGTFLAAKFSTTTGGNQCISAASPAVCGDNSAGMVAIPTGGTLTVNTTKATLNSTIIFIRDNSLSAKLGVTCNTQSSLTLGTAYVNGRSDNTSFDLKLDVAPTTDPVCGSYLIVN